MFNATEFTYDGVYSGRYGLKIASLNSAVVEETPYVTPNIVTTKASKAKQFEFMDSSYDNPPSIALSLTSMKPMPDVIQREILSWLDNRKGFKQLKIHQPELEEYTYNCIFTVESTVYHKGNCIGFNLTATFDSPYQYKKSKQYKLSGSGGQQSLRIFVDSDVADDYIYPTVVFKTNKAFEDDKSISIINQSDDILREFLFRNISNGSTVNVDNETKIIKADGEVDLLQRFDGYNWLRLKRGKNELLVRINGEMTLICPQYVKIRL